MATPRKAASKGAPRPAQKTGAKAPLAASARDPDPREAAGVAATCCAVERYLDRLLAAKIPGLHVMLTL